MSVNGNLENRMGKSQMESSTVKASWAQIVTGMAVIIGSLFGADVPEETQATIIEVGGAVIGALVVVLGSLSWRGRVKAVKRIR